jgi:Tfp pilus assembly protein PilO
VRADRHGAGYRPLRADEPARVLAEHDRELERLRAEHQQALAEARAETALLQQEIDVLRRMVPSQFEPDVFARRLQALAKAGDMAPLEMKPALEAEKVRLANGSETPYERYRMEVTGQGLHEQIAVLFDRVGRLPLVVELESLSLDAAAYGTVRFSARLGFPTYAGWPDTPTPPLPAALPARHRSTGDERSDRQDILFAYRAQLRRMIEAERAPLRRMQDEVAAVAEMRQRSPARFHAALSRFDAGVEGRMVALTSAHFGARATIHGVAMGATARAALRPAFESAGFAIETLDVAPAGDCRAFSVSARLEPRESDGAPFDFGPGRFEARAATACSAKPAAALGRVVARGTKGDLTLTLRDTDLADVFHVLSRLTGANFVVGAGVKGRVDVDLDRVTLDEACAAMRAAGVTVGPGPLRLVSAAKPAIAFVQASHEPAVSLSLTGAVLLDVLRLFEEVSGRPGWTAPVADRRVTIFANEVPWDVALRGIAASVGMTTVVEEGRFFVGPAALAKAPWGSGVVEVARAKTAESDPRWGRILEIAKVSPEDLTPLGLARTPEGGQAIAYGPGRVMWLLESGDSLLAARVHAVGRSDVTFVAADGRKSVVRFAPPGQ